MTAKDLMKKMEAAGWEYSYARGSNHYYIHPDRLGQKVPIPVHKGKDLNPNTLASIKRGTGLKF